MDRFKQNFSGHERMTVQNFRRSLFGGSDLLKTGIFVIFVIIEHRFVHFLFIDYESKSALIALESIC